MQQATERRQRLATRYLQLKDVASDINEHLLRLYQAGQTYSHITEFGTRWGCSTTGFLWGQAEPSRPDEEHPWIDGPPKLVCYDIHRSDEVDELERMTEPGHLQFIQGSTLEATIEPTQCLFIDTFHTYSQLAAELLRHHEQVACEIIFHDTVTFGDSGEDGRSPGLRAALEEFLRAFPQWKQTEFHTNNNGLSVIKRTQESRLERLEAFRDCYWIKK